MILTQDGVTREQLVQLLELSISSECQFLLPIKPNTNIVNDEVYQQGSAIRFLKVDEVVAKSINRAGEVSYSYSFNIKLLIEDKYWEIPEDTVKGKKYIYVRTGIITGVKEKVLQILQVKE
jgi:hypothetical protein